MIISGDKDNQMEVAYVQTSNDGRYEICARWNEAGRYRIVERLIVREQAELLAQQIRTDDQLRHRIMIETKDWDWVTDAPRAPKEKRERQPHEPAPTFSFED